MGFLTSLSPGAGSLISGAFSGATGLLGSLLSIGQQNKMLKAQQHENQLNRDFNSSEAQKLRDFQVQMFNMTNDYNDPSKVVQRLQSAGLNPALAFGGFQNASFGGSSAQATSSGSISPTSADMSGISNMGFAATQSALAVKSAQADIDLKKSQAAANWKDVEWKDAINSSEVAHKYADIFQLYKLGDKHGAEIGQIIKSCEEIDARISNIHIDTNNKELFYERTFKELQYFDIDKHLDIQTKVATIQDIFASAKLKQNQAIEVATMLTYMIAESESRTSLNKATERNQAQQAVTWSIGNGIDKAMIRKYGLTNVSDKQWDQINATLRLTNQSATSMAVHSGVEIANVCTEIASMVLSRGVKPPKVGFK